MNIFQIARVKAGSHHIHSDKPMANSTLPLICLNKRQELYRKGRQEREEKLSKSLRSWRPLR